MKADDKEESEMRTAPLGNTGVEVSVLCLGTMHFGSRTDKETSYRILDRYGLFAEWQNPGCLAVHEI